MYLKAIKEELKSKGKLELESKKVAQLLEQAFVKDNQKCWKCGRTSNLTYEHIIPKSILQNFNIDASRTFWEENSETSCFACNQLKAHNLDFSNPKTKELLLKLLV